MRKKSKNEDIIYNLIKQTYNMSKEADNDLDEKEKEKEAHTSTFIALQQAIKQNNFEGFSNVEHAKDNLMHYLKVDRESFTNKFGLNNSFLFQLCSSYVKQLRSNLYSNNKIEDIARKEDESEESIIYSFFILMHNEINDKYKISEEGIDDDLKMFKTKLGGKRFVSTILLNMTDAFEREIKKESLLEQVKEKSFYRNTAQNIRMLLDKKNSQLLSGIVDTKKDYRKILKNDKYKVNEKEEVHKDVKKQLHAVSTIGQKRENQEDAAILMVHPNNPNLKIAAVCDGAGGHRSGEVASFYLAKALQDFFIEEGEDIYESKTDKEQDKKIINAIKKINRQGYMDINSQYDTEQHSLTTMVCAIILDGKVKIINVGDSRAYCINNGNLTQITIDDSLAQEEYEKYKKSISPYIHNDDMRFFIHSNCILNSFFSDKEFFSDIQIYTLEKDEYDKIILCSDGVSDCMSNEEIAYFSKNVEGKRLANFLVQAANINKSELPIYLQEMQSDSKDKKDKKKCFHKEIFPSKDNATAVVIESDNQKNTDKDFER